MPETHPGPDSEKSIWRAAVERKLRRQLTFLELADISTEQAGAEPTETFEDTEPFLAPWQVYELFRKTSIGAYLPDPGDLVMDVLISGLAGPGYYEPLATERPERAYIRRTLIPGDAYTDCNRQLGIVLQFDHDNSSRLLTAEAECGVALFPDGFNVYRRSRILVNHSPYAMQPTELYRCNTGVVDEFLSNMQGIIGASHQPIMLQELPGPRPIGDTMPIHDDTPPTPDNN